MVIYDVMNYGPDDFFVLCSNPYDAHVSLYRFSDQTKEQKYKVKIPRRVQPNIVSILDFAEGNGDYIHVAMLRDEKLYIDFINPIMKFQEQATLLHRLTARIQWQKLSSGMVQQDQGIEPVEDQVTEEDAKMNMNLQELEEFLELEDKIDDDDNNEDK